MNAALLDASLRARIFPTPRLSHASQGKLLLLGLALAISVAGASEPNAADSALAEAQPSPPGRTLQDLLPLAWQTHPSIRFNVITEMTAEGRKRTPPTSDKPAYYVSTGAKFVQMGWTVAAGEKPPSVAELETAMRDALAVNHYLPVLQPERRPDVVIIMNFGSHGTDPESSADELVTVLGDPSLLNDVIDRAKLMGGEPFALSLKAALAQEAHNAETNTRLAKTGSPIHLPVSPEGGSPFQIFLNSGGKGSLVEHFGITAFRTCYFVVASAYDFASAEKKEKILLWRTKMTVDSQGVSMKEILRPLIANAGAYLGRDMPTPAVVKKRIDRQGRVEVGTPIVVENPAPVMPTETTTRP